MKYIGGTKLDERIIRTDLDPGFQEGRQYGYVAIGQKKYPNRDFHLFLMTDYGHLDVVNRVVRSATNIETNMILGEVGTVAPLPKNVRKKRMNTAREGS